MKTIYDAVCKNKISCVRLMLDAPLAHVTKVHRNGDRKFLFTKYKEDTITYKGVSYSFNDLCKYLSPIALYITGENEVRYESQVIVYYQITASNVKAKCYSFDTDLEARDYYVKLIKENSLEQVNSI